MSKKKGESFGKQLLRSVAKQFQIKEKEPKRPCSSSLAKHGTSRSNDAGAGSSGASGSGMQVHHDQGPSSPEQSTSRRNYPRTWSGASDSSKQVHHEEAESIIHDLQKMQCNEDKFNNKTSLSVDLRKIALDKGFAISDNGGSGNCMFFALSEQLRSVKGVHISHEELRKTLVQFLSENANLHDGSPLFNFVSGYPSWPEYLGSMAKDGTWGDHLVLLSAANYFQTPIHIISNLGHDIVINPDRPVATTHPLVLGHIHELHYVSLLPIQDTLYRQLEQKIAKIDDKVEQLEQEVKIQRAKDFKPGVFAAAHDGKEKWVLVKGVASCADHSQDLTDEWKSFASTIATYVVANILSDPTVFQKWPHCCQDTLYRQLEQKIAKIDDKVEQLEQEVKIQRAKDFKPEPSTVEPFDVKTCRTKLAEHYQRTATVPTSVWCKKSLVDIHEIYTQLSWVKQEQTPAGASLSELTHYIDLFTANKKDVVPKRILVQGQTAIGKSTFVKKLAVDWAELDDEKTGDEQKAALKKFELVVVVNLKEVSKYESLSDVISRSRIFAEEDKSLTEGLLTYIRNNQEKVLMVFDGYDEYRSGRNSEIYEIFNGKRLRNCCVLITTRNSKADELLEFKVLHAEITGFSSEDMEDFMERILGSWEQAENLLDHLGKKHLLGLAKVPLLLLFFCTLWKHGQLKSFPKTKTKLYMEIVQYVLDHAQRKHSPHRPGKVHDFKEILVEVGKVALEGLLKNDHVFEYEELSAAIRCQESFIVGLLQVTEYSESLRPAGMVCFIHKSIQEFVAAWYIAYGCKGNLGPVEKHARSLEDCQSWENVFQFVCGLTDEGAVKVFKHLDSVRISDTSLTLCTVPDVNVPLCDITERQWKFNDFVLDSFQEVQSKAELSKNCFDCVGGIIPVSETLSKLPLVNDLKSWSIYFLRKGFWRAMMYLSDNTKPVSNLYKWLVSCNNGSSELHELLSFLERWQSVECKSCTFDSCLCFRNDQVYIYITDLWLFCSAHATLFTEAAKSAVPSDSANLYSELFNLNFLGSLACKDSVGESFRKAFGTIFRNCKHLRNIRLCTAGDLLCDILKQLPNLDKYSMWIGFPQEVDSPETQSRVTFCRPLSCNLKSEEAVELAGFLPRFDNVIVLNLNSKDCSAAAVTTLVSSITHKYLQELLLSEISMTPEVAAALGQSLPKLSSLQRLVLRGTEGGINLQAADMETLFRGFNEPSPLVTLDLSYFNMRGSLASLAKRLRFFPNLKVLHLENLNLDGSDLCGLLESFSFIPNLLGLNLMGNPLGHAVTSIVPHITKLSKDCSVWLLRTGCSEEDRIHVDEAFKQVRPFFNFRV